MEPGESFVDVESNHLSEINTVDDFEDLMRVINNPALTEFQYLVDGIHGQSQLSKSAFVEGL